MTRLQLVSKEWKRRPVRSGITAAGVALATAALFSLLSFERGYRNGIHQEMDKLGAHVLLAPKGCPFDAASMALHGAAWPCYLKEKYLEEVRSVAGVAAAAPVFMTTRYSGTNQSIYVGIETNMLALKPGWRIQGHFPAAKGEVLIGSEIARRLGAQTGSSLRLFESNLTASVGGILEPTGGADDTFIFMRLSDAQSVFGHPHELTHILVRLTDPNLLDQAVTHLRGCDAGLAMNVIPIAHIFRTIQSLVKTTSLLLGCIALVALLTAMTGVANALMMAVAERTSEIGIMRACGASRSQVFRLLCAETLQVCLCGGLVGVALALTGAATIESWVRGRLPFAPSQSLLGWDWRLALICILCATLTGSIAALLPAWRAARALPMLAIRNGERRL